MATTTDKIMVGLVLAVAVAVLPPAAYMAWRLHVEEQEGLATRAETSDGIVVAIEYTTKGGTPVPDSNDPVVVFWTKSGQRVTQRVDANLPDKSLLGRWVRVRYDAWDPSTAGLAGEGQGETGTGTIAGFEQGTANGFPVPEVNHPVVEFTPAGETAPRRFTEPDVTFSDVSRKGGSITVAYRRDDPSRAVALAP